MRSLAQRSSSAAKEIKDLIANSVGKIRDGSALASEAGKTMSEVTLAVSRVTDIMAEIAAASSEQSRGIEQVNVAITQMDNVTQQNAALVEEAAAASRSMEDQGVQLNEVVGFFRVVEGGALAPAVAGPYEAPRRELAVAVAAAPVPASGRKTVRVSSGPVAALTGATTGANADDGWDRF